MAKANIVLQSREQLVSLLNNNMPIELIALYFGLSVSTIRKCITELSGAGYQFEKMLFLDAIPKMLSVRRLFKGVEGIDVEKLCGCVAELLDLKRIVSILESVEETMDDLSSFRFDAEVPKSYQMFFRALVGESLCDITHDYNNLSFAKAYRCFQIYLAKASVNSENLPVGDYRESWYVPVTDIVRNFLINESAEKARPVINQVACEALRDRLFMPIVNFERERSVINMYFGFGGKRSTLEEIGEELNLTTTRILQIKEKALKHLRREANKLRLFSEKVNSLENIISDFKTTL